MIKRSFVLFFLFNSTLLNAQQQGAVELLQKMQHAMATLNYQGTVAFMEDGQLDTMQYFHVAQQGHEQERLKSLNSPMREVIRDAGKVSCTYKESQKRVVNHRPVSQSFIIDLPKDLASLTASYKVELIGEESVAMKQAQIISIHPLDDYRYRRQVWLDKQQNLPLKVEVYQADGTTLEQVVFTDLNIKDELPLAKPDHHEDLKVQHIHQIESESFDNASFSLNNIPSGYEKIFFTRLSMHQSSNPVDHLLLSDGFSSISVYIDARDDEMQTGLQTVGSVNSYSFIEGEKQITVMGKVPAAAVEYIAKGIQLN